MNTKRNYKRWLAVFAMLSALMLGSIIASAAEDTDTITVNVTATYGQTDARSILKMINDFRAESGVWYWSEDGDHKEKTVYNTADSIELSPLQYDYELEEIAMKRAMQIALQYEHTRPDAPINPDPGNQPTNSADCVFPLIPGYRTAGENIAAGYPTAEDVFVGWQEEEKDYWGQGHRRNMLNPKFTSVGIGYVRYNGTDYWVQVFRAPTGTAAETDPLDEEVTRSVEILKENITKQEVTASENSLKIPYGDSIPLPGIKCKLLLNKTWPKNSLRPVTLDSASTEWSVESGADCVTIDPNGKKIVGEKCGTAEISTTVWNTPVTVSVEVTPKPIDDAEIILDSDADLSYTGKGIEPAIEVTLSDTPLEANTDYTVSYSNNTDVGTATVTITGAGNYTGKATAEFEIVPAKISSISDISDHTYTGFEIRPLIIVYCGSVMLSDGDYEIAFGNNIDAGTATVSVTGKGNYTGTLEQTFSILPVSILKCSHFAISPQEYTGSQIQPRVSVQWNDQELEAGKDYAFEYGENTEVGPSSGFVSVTGKGNFTGTNTIYFDISPADLSSAEVDEIESLTYTGSEIIVEPAVTLNGKALKKDTDYTLSYKQNVNAGQALVLIEGIGNYAGTLEKEFTILPVALTEDAYTVELDSDVYSYAGKVIEPAVTVSEIASGDELELGTDYSVSYNENINVGTATVIVTGENNYSGTLERNFVIQPKELDETFHVTIPDQTYTGTAVEPSVSILWGSVELTEGKDFSVTYSGDHTDVGIVNVKISGMKNYSGTLDESFEILRIDLNECSVNAIADQTYTGAEIRPEFTVSLGDYELVEGKDYTASYKNNTAVTTDSKAEITLSGQGNFAGGKTLTFSIVPIDLAKEGAKIQAIADQAYTGEEIIPEVSVSLNGTLLSAETDYTVSYRNNTDVGTAAVTVTGQGNYKGEVSASFQILPLKLSKEDCVLGEIPAQTYTGKVITPSVTVSFGEKTLTQGVDYTVSYSNNMNVGEAIATVTAMGNYKGDLGNISFPILPTDLADCTTDQIADQTYTGSVLTPPVTVYLGELGLVLDQDYTVSYEDNIQIGTAVVTLTGINNFTGTCTLNFNITAPAPSVPSVSLPQPGTTATDSASGAKCRVSGSDASGATVEYIAPANKKKTTVTIPDVVVINHVPCKVTSIAPNAFKNNKKLKKVTVGKNVTSIGKNAFRGCSKLTTIKLNAQITSINAAAFYGCTALKNVTIPATVKSIGKQAFYKCSRLKKITIKSKQLTSKSIGSKAFSKVNSKAVIKVPAKQKKAYRKLLKKKGLPSGVKIK